MARAGETTTVARFREIRDATPGFFIAVAGLAFALFVKESQKMPTFQSVSMGSPERWLPALIALAPILALLLAYRAKPRLLIYRNPTVGFLIGGITMLSALPLSGILVIDVPPNARFACLCVLRSCELLVLVCWGEALLQLKARTVAVIVGTALIAVGALDIVASTLRSDFAGVCTAAVAPLSMGLLYWFKDYNHFLQNDAGAGGDAWAIDPDLQQGSTPSSKRFIAALLIPFACYPFVLGGIHSTWIPLQGVEMTALGVQLSYAVGAICAGILCIFLAATFWGRRKIELYNLIALPFLLLALYLTAISHEGYLLLYAFLQSFVEKLAICLLFVTPYLVVTKLSAALVWTATLTLFEIGKLLSSSMLTALSSEAYANCMIVAVLALSATSLAIVGLDSTRGTTWSATEAGSENEGRPTREPDHGAQVRVEGEVGGKRAASVGAGAKGDAAFAESPVEIAARKYRLTSREEEVLELAASGMTAAAIAEELIISPGTAKSHLRNIYAKLGVHTQSELILLVGR